MAPGRGPEHTPWASGTVPRTAASIKNMKILRYLIADTG